MYKCAIVGVSGNRARGHAEAYQHIKRGRLAAISTRQRDKLDEFGDEFHIKARYTDYRDMFERERPDLVHVNTPPNVRLEIFQAAEAAGVPALIVEKPIAIQGEDCLAIRDFAQHCRVKIAVNHQLHFHPRRMVLQQLVQDGKIGEVRFLEASAGMNLAYQGTHSLQALSAFNPTGNPTTVFGQVSGTDGLRDNPKQHFAPDQCLAAITYDNRLSALLRCGTNAPLVGDGPVYTHKRIAVYGSRGHIYWTMWSWELNCDGKVESGSHDYWAEDILGQAAMTEAVFDWLENDKAVHPLNLEVSLRDFNLILGIYMSALHHQVVRLPVQPGANLIAMLRQRLDKDSVADM